MEPEKRRDRTKQQNRQTILAAARLVFAEMGFGAATVRDIIRATPLASGTFYNYFKSKEEVYQALRDEMAVAIRPQLHDERSKADSAEAFIRGSFGIFFEFLAANRAEFTPLTSAGQATRLRMDSPELAAGFEELRADIQSAVARGLFPDVDPDFLSAAMIGVAFELSERMCARGFESGQAAAEFATQLFLGGIKALPRPFAGMGAPQTEARS